MTICAASIAAGATKVRLGLRTRGAEWGRPPGGVNARPEPARGWPAAAVPGYAAARAGRKKRFDKRTWPYYTTAPIRPGSGMPHYLDFEQPIAELEGKIEELRHLTGEHGVNIAEEVGKLQAKVDRQLRAVYGKLTAWQKVQVARHPERPHFNDVVARLVTEFTPLAGDRLYGDDAAILGGLGRIDGRACVVIGHEKGADTDDRVKRNFGMAKPEGYRKARRLMEMADRFKLPLVALVDTPGAYPGVEAEARGQAEAIARCLETCMSIRVPFVAAILGEGGSGGAIAIAAANRVLMFEHAVYSVITPEGCASILWRSAEQAKDAAEALKLTAQDLMKLGIIDGIVSEPMGGAHRDHERAITALGAAIKRELDGLAADSPDLLKARRREKYLEMGRSGIA